MNFKITILFLTLISACGVKGPPTSPKGKALPSFMKNYPDAHVENEDKVEKVYR